MAMKINIHVQKKSLQQQQATNPKNRMVSRGWVDEMVNAVSKIHPNRSAASTDGNPASSQPSHTTPAQAG